ncbi:MAG: AAA family ATPase [Desulfovibrionaceae bacterium]|nr:AAA family ATPase [Desulfovibrionaceae bacterium]
MISQNFSKLKNNWPKLYEHAAKAEQYLASDPQAAIVMLRCYAELLVDALYDKLSLRITAQDSFYKRLANAQFREVIPSDILTKLHAIRIWGNRAAHGTINLGEEARRLLKEAYLLAKWFFLTIEDNDSTYPDFSMPNFCAQEADPNSTIEKLSNRLEQALAELSQLQNQFEQATHSTYNNPNEELLLEFHRNGLQVANQIPMEPWETAKLLKLKDAFADYELSPDQSALVDKLDKFLQSKTEKVFLLQGFAGTGKTFITRGLTEYFKITGRNYILAAPTGKAAKVIASKANSPAYTIHKTIYAFEDLKEYTQEVAGSETFKFYAKLAVNSHPADTVYIADEASMISDHYNEGEFFQFGSGCLLKDFLEYVNFDHNDHRKKLIFIGDKAQLPPVGMTISPALNPKYLQKKYNLSTVSYILTNVVRQKNDSGILKNANMLRRSLDENCFNRLIMDTSLPDVKEIKYEEVIESYFRACNGKVNNNTILIAFSNADVKEYNFALRKRLLPGCSHEIYPGDKIMANNNNTFYGFFISNGDFGMVSKVLGNSERRNIIIRQKNLETNRVNEIPITLSFRNVEVDFRDENGSPRFFEAKILENLLYNDHQDISSAENKALYIDFCIRHQHLRRGTKEFKDTLKADPYFNALRVKFGYAITCHKAQGSEWQHVFVKCRNSNTGLNENYFRWLYTAITRASENLYLIDPPKYQLTSGLRPIAIPPVLPPSPSPMVSQVKTDEPVINAGNIVSTSSVGACSSKTNPYGNEASSTSPTVKEDSNGNFGLTDESPFLLAILQTVRELLAGTGLQITSIIHNNFLEAYFFKDDAETARINIWYKANQTVSSIATPKDTPLSKRLISLLTDPLKSISFVKRQPIQPMDFSNSFLKEFYEEIVGIVSKHDITVQNVESHQYCQRYTFVRGKEVAIFNIWYNKKKKFTKFEPFKSSPSSLTLEHDLIQLLTNLG